jgi:HEAT repeat protein
MYEKGDVYGLIRAASYKEDTVKMAAIEALAVISPRDVERLTDTLLEILHNNDQSMRASAAYAMRYCGERAIKPLVNVGFMDESPHVRSSATAALRTLGKPALNAVTREQVSKLRALLHPDTEERESAIKALRNIGWKPETESEIVRFKIACQSWEDLVIIGEPAVETLISLMGNEYDDGMRGKAAETLTKIGRCAVVQLIKSLRNQDTHIRGTVASVLGEIGEKASVERLEPLLDDSDPWVREKTEEALEKLKRK